MSEIKIKINGEERTHAEELSLLDKTETSGHTLNNESMIKMPVIEHAKIEPILSGRSLRGGASDRTETGGRGVVQGARSDQGRGRGSELGHIALSVDVGGTIATSRAIM